MALSEVIKSSRIQKGLKQEDVARELQVTVQTYSKWENGKTEPKASQVAKLASLLDVSISEICKGERNETLDLTDFLREKSKAIQGVDEFDQNLVLWDCISDHKGYIENLKSYKEY